MTRILTRPSPAITARFKPKPTAGRRCSRLDPTQDRIRASASVRRRNVQVPYPGPLVPKPSHAKEKPATGPRASRAATVPKLSGAADVCTSARAKSGPSSTPFSARSHRITVRRRPRSKPRSAWWVLSVRPYLALTQTRSCTATAPARSSARRERPPTGTVSERPRTCAARPSSRTWVTAAAPRASSVGTPRRVAMLRRISSSVATGSGSRALVRRARVEAP
jgi:hypothetical protein